MKLLLSAFARQAWGERILAAPDGAGLAFVTAEEALQRIPAVRPDVAVLDVRLPDGSGVEVCRELRSQLPGLACLMLTSFSDDDALFARGPAGEHLLSLLDRTTLPVIVTLHTVLEKPNADERRVLEGLLHRAAKIVVMAERGRDILRRESPTSHDLDPHRLEIPR